MNKNLIRRGKASERIAFHFLGIAIALGVTGVLISIFDNSVVAWIFPISAMPAAGGGVVAWYWSTKWHRAFLSDAPWTPVETLIADAKDCLLDVEARSFYRSTPDDLDSVIRALDDELAKLGDSASRAELKKAVGGATTLDAMQCKKIHVALVAIADSYRSKWQIERAAWERAWREG